MIVRAIDFTSHEWMFGKGANDYRKNNDAVAQNINTRLNCFLGDCFFDITAGLDWFNLMSNKSILPLNLAVSAVILNTAFVTSMQQFSGNLSDSRVFSCTYQVVTSFSTTASGTFVFDSSIGG